jgi:uncharacterized membrane protein
MFKLRFVGWMLLCVFAALGIWVVLGAFSLILWAGGCFGLGTMFGMTIAKLK